MFEWQLDEQEARYCSHFNNEHHMAYLLVSLGKYHLNSTLQKLYTP